MATVSKSFIRDAIEGNPSALREWDFVMEEVNNAALYRDTLWAMVEGTDLTAEQLRLLAQNALDLLP